MDARELTAAYIAAKEAERAAKTRTQEIEAQILELYGTGAVEGTEKIAEGGAEIKISYKLSRSFDEDALTDAWDSLTPRARGCVKTKTSLDLTAYRKIVAHYPDDAKALARCIIEKPGKPSVDAKFVEV